MKSCASWLEGKGSHIKPEIICTLARSDYATNAGLWSTVSCKNSSEFSNGLMKCECHTLSYFGVIIVSWIISVVQLYLAVHTSIELGVCSV